MASSAGPFFDPLLSGLPQRFSPTAAACVHQPAAVVAKRARALRELRPIDATMAPFRERWTRALPGNSPIRTPTSP